MKLHEHRREHMNLIGRYGDGSVQVNNDVLQAPFIVAPGFLHTAWVRAVDDLQAAALEPLWPLEPRILLLGTASGPQGQTLRALRAELAARQVALESMDLGAACRTYNVLAQEDRPVAALLFP